MFTLVLIVITVRHFEELYNKKNAINNNKVQYFEIFLIVLQTNANSIRSQNKAGNQNCGNHDN